MNFKPLLSVIISSVCNIAFFREKHVLSESGEKYADHAVFTSANSSKQMCGFVFNVKGQQGVELFTGGLLWFMYFSQKKRFEIKTP